MTRSSRPSRGRAPSAAGLVLSLLLSATAARGAVTADQCIDANNKAQTDRREGRFGAARTELTLCGDASCPRLVRSDCVRRLDELDHAQPSMVFDVKDAAGNDVGSVTVKVDGRVLADRITGTALEVDPGEHAFTFEAAGQATLTRTFVIKEGEKARRERIVLAAPPPVSALPDTRRSADLGVETGHRMSTGRIWGLAIGSAGLAGFAVGGVFGVLAIVANSAQKSDCESSSSCPEHMQAVSEHGTFETDGNASTAAFIAGGVLVATGAILFVASPKGGTPASSTAWSVAPFVGRGGEGVGFTGNF